MLARYLLSATLLCCAGAALAVDDAALTAARANYRTYCVQCHGIDGNGKGVNIHDMSVMPRDHTDAKSMSGRSDEMLFKVIKEGGPAIDKSVLMPPWGATLSDDEIRALVAYLRELCRCAFGAGS